jgi:hypothetical protein
MRNTKSRRHQKSLSQDPKDAKGSSENAGKAENAHLNPEKAEGEDDRLGQTEAADRVEIGSGEESVVDRQG